jgi:hypothetical protein
MHVDWLSLKEDLSCALSSGFLPINGPTSYEFTVSQIIR